MGIHPKIGITGLPRSGKSAVMEKVLSMLKEERTRELAARISGTETEIIGGICTEPILDGSERLGYSVRNIVTGETATIAHKEIDSRLRVLGYGLDTEGLEKVAVPAIEFAIEHCEVIELQAPSFVLDLVPKIFQKFVPKIQTKKRKMHETRKI